MNWGECKLITLQKLDPAAKSLSPTRNTKDYLNAMVGVANRGLQDLVTAGKYITKKYEIMQPELKNNIAGADFEIKQHINSDISIQANGRSYYFEVEGNATVEIYKDGTLLKTINNSSKGALTKHKGITGDSGIIEIRFTGAYPYSYRNVAIYDIAFEDDKDVWEYTREKRYDLKELTDDFYRLVNTNLVFDNETYKNTHDYYWEGESTLVLPGTEAASFKVHYYAYPQIITSETTDDKELSLDPEVANLLPVYMASELMEDDDSSLAFYFREQYTEAKARLTPTQVQGRSVFIDEQGWS
jgi:hypothetical protein